MPKGMSLNERFELLVNRTIGCHLWIGSKDADGYGRILYAGKTRKAHRVAWFLHYGEWPQKNRLNHMCCNRACVNVTHLEDVSHDEDIAYRDNLGRQSKGSHRYSAKLDEPIIPLIRIDYATGHFTQAQLAEKYGVSSSTINHILTGRTWRHVK